MSEVGVALRVVNGKPNMKIRTKDSTPGDIALALFNLDLCKEKLHDVLKKSTTITEDKG